MGVSPKRGPKGAAAAAELQSITANGKVTVDWFEGTRRSTLEGRRLVIRPAAKARESDRITLVQDDGSTMTLSGSPLRLITTKRSSKGKLQSPISP